MRSRTNNCPVTCEIYEIPKYWSNGFEKREGMAMSVRELVHSWCLCYPSLIPVVPGTYYYAMFFI
jgi:hypothetical protein